MQISSDSDQDTGERPITANALYGLSVLATLKATEQVHAGLPDAARNLMEWGNAFRDAAREVEQERTHG